MSDITRPTRGGQDPPAILRLVHPAPPQPKRRPTRAPLFTPEEEARLKAALRNARRLFDGWAPLARAMGVFLRQPQRAATTHPVTAEIALRLARVLRVPVESLMRPPAAVPMPPIGNDGGAA